MSPRAVRLLGLVLLPALLLPLGAQSIGQDVAPDPLAALAWNTDAAAQRFVAVHGRRAVVMGYPQHGLEVWAYPLQLISDYQISFATEGSAAPPLAGNGLLRHIEYRPDEVIRTYVGADFVVRETLFTPLDKRGVILSYEVEGNHDLRVHVEFLPSLNLMWPGALGGQDVGWNAALNGYVLTEPLHGNAASIASPDIVAHDPVINRTLPASDLETLVLRPTRKGSGEAVASLYIAADEPGTAHGTAVRDLQANDAALREESLAHYRRLVDTALSIETPDPEVNRAVAWSTVVLDQAWACNPAIGCGALAGFGPSRRGRRPQYAWFFAGDGLVATEAWTASGAFDRAREELEFILKYQNPDNGMIWHEISQGVELEQWKRSYPYMYVHVDITYQFLTTLARFLEASGDVDFLRTHQAAVAAAFRYCQSLTDPATSLPRIPPGGESFNEQDRMRDDTSLSAAWIVAAEAMARMDRMLRDDKQAQAATAAAEAARRSVAALDWDPTTHFWLAGHTASGEPMHTFRPGLIELLSEAVFTPDQSREILNKLTSDDFQTDWGVRNLSASSPGYDPSAYGGGSVSALGTAQLAQGLWDVHWNVPALQLWEEILPWTGLDSQGHIHELLAGDVYHPEIESVPEQTWSSAGLLTATARGLLGLAVEGADNRFTFAPHLVPQWKHLAVRHVRVNRSQLDLELTYGENAIDLNVDNGGEPVTLSFAPELPLGATAVSATVSAGSAQARRTDVRLQSTPTDSHAVVTLALPRGRTHCHLEYRGGVETLVPASNPIIGSGSHNLHLGAVRWVNGTLQIDAYEAPGEKAQLLLHTRWQPTAAEGAQITETAPNTYALQLPPHAAEDNARPSPDGYALQKIAVRFKQP